MKLSYTALAIALPLALVACGGESNDDPSTQVGEEVAAQRPVFTSSYSEVASEKSCKVTEPMGEESDAMTSECTGVGAYSLRIFSGDLRQRAFLLGATESEFAIDPFGIVPEGPGWNTVGPKAEWRSTQNDLAHPHALILRHTFDTLDEEGNVNGPRQHYLTVVKIDGANTCLYGVVEASKASATANQTARDLADAARSAKGCPETVTITTKK